MSRNLTKEELAAVIAAGLNGASEEKQAEMVSTFLDGSENVTGLNRPHNNPHNTAGGGIKSDTSISTGAADNAGTEKSKRESSSTTPEAKNA